LIFHSGIDTGLYSGSCGTDEDGFGLTTTDVGEGDTGGDDSGLGIALLIFPSCMDTGLYSGSCGIDEDGFGVTTNVWEGSTCDTGGDSGPGFEIGADGI
jgi:hypothetical protein